MTSESSYIVHMKKHSEKKKKRGEGPAEQQDACNDL